ncbi:hypothetical protein B0H14DRAFT_3505561 [Mycena olivaceomarginata]|nr:hypothetical protein B0H14DRAFT_3505561 [Mycena olivaceomarginata]
MEEALMSFLTGVRSPSVLRTARRLMAPVDHLYHDGTSFNLPSETYALPTIHIIFSATRTRSHTVVSRIRPLRDWALDSFL